MSSEKLLLILGLIILYLFLSKNKEAFYPWSVYGSIRQYQIHHPGIHAYLKDSDRYYYPSKKYLHPENINSYRFQQIPLAWR